MTGLEFLAWAVGPFLIFLARLLDVTLMTMRIIFVSRGKKFIAQAFVSVDEIRSAREGSFRWKMRIREII